MMSNYAIGIIIVIIILIVIVIFLIKYKNSKKELSDEERDVLMKKLRTLIKTQNIRNDIATEDYFNDLNESSTGFGMRYSEIEGEDDDDFDVNDGAKRKRKTRGKGELTESTMISKHELKKYIATADYDKIMKWYRQYTTIYESLVRIPKNQTQLEKNKKIWKYAVLFYLIKENPNHFSHSYTFNINSKGPELFQSAVSFEKEKKQVEVQNFIVDETVL